MDWITCSSCEEEFRVISDADLPTSFCPFCGEEMLIEEEAVYDWESVDNTRL